MAHGYAMVTGKPQAMMVHVGVGTANSINGLINASRQNVPILFTAGRTPITESGALPAARNNYIHWAQEHFDQGGMLREFMKWDYELRHAEQVETVIDRALAIAKSEPQGPVYVTLPREILASPFPADFLQTRPSSPASPPAADPEALEEAAKLLGAAQHPLLITANGGRTLESSRAIEQLAQTLAVPVVHYRPRHLALSTEHPMHCGWDPHALLKEADVVLVVDCDVPWIPKEGQPKPDAKVIHIGPDPLFAALSAARLPHRHRAHRRGRADAAGAVARGAEAGGLGEADRGAPQESSPTYSKQVEKESAGGAEPMPASITGKWLSACVNKLLDAQHHPRQRVPDGARGNGDQGARPLLRQSVRRRARLGHGRGARREARLAGQDGDLRGRRRRLHVRQPDRGALRLRGDAPAGAVHHRQQRALGGGASLDAFDLSEGLCCGDQGSPRSPRSSPRRASSTWCGLPAATASASASRSC